MTVIVQNNSLNIFEEIYKKSKKTVMCHGVFDLLHLGHIRHFKDAKKLGEILIVSVTADKFVNKGPGRPYFNLSQRMEAIASLNCVDYVVPSNSEDAIKILNIVKPKIYCKGEDYKKHSLDITKKIKKEISVVKKYKGRIYYTNNITFSSSNLINKSFDTFNENQTKTILNIKDFLKKNDIEEYFKNLKTTNVLLIGEAIIDQYIFCSPLGKSSKDPILTFKQISKKNYIGGSLAIAKQLSPYCKKINLITLSIKDREYKKFVKKNLPNNVNIIYVDKKNSKTIVKKRYVDFNSNNKLIGIYDLEDDYFDNKFHKKITNTILNQVNKNNVTIISDYGHNLMDKKIVNLLKKKSKFISANVQLNSANTQKHSINNYTNVDSLIINEAELRSHLRNTDSELKKLIKKICKDLDLKFCIVTCGKQGAYLYNSKKNKFFYSAAFAKNVVDKVGSGDAMFSLISIFLSVKADENISLFIGSLAAAISVENQANSSFLNEVILKKTIKHILA
tara:strand:+ start:3740 stop:5257 length:1518 start_codon:yes stop_codon:yes gene_type:complete